MPDDKFVTKVEWKDGQGKIHERINEIDRKHTENYHQMIRSIDRQTLIQERSLETQKSTEKILEQINEVLTGVLNRVVDLEYRTKDVEDDVDSMKTTLSSEKKGNRDVLIAWITTIGLGITPLMAFLGTWLFR